MSEEMRATREEIFAHVRALVDDEAVKVSLQVADEYVYRDKTIALSMMKEYDTTLGGVGIYRSGEMKLPGVYRALSYNEIPMLHGHAHESGRSMIHSSCSYIEGLIQKLVFLWPWESFRTEGLPLGALIKRIEKRLPSDLAQELWWLNKRVGVFAKHHFNLEKEKQARRLPDRYFELDEAIAVYYLVRVLGMKLENLSGKTYDVFLEGWELPEWKMER